ncbi:MAG: DUF3052 family protein [Cyclobacteriaceae bacterium]
MNPAGYSNTPLVKKLGIKEGMKCIFVNTPSHYVDLLIDIPDISVLNIEDAEEETTDFVHLFVKHQKELENAWLRCKSTLKKTGSLWVSWPKATSQLPKDIDGNYVRRFGLSGGLVDTKVCAIDADWSGIKFMYRREDR